jgi:hypothetical protein
VEAPEHVGFLRAGGRGIAPRVIFRLKAEATRPVPEALQAEAPRLGNPVASDFRRKASIAAVLACVAVLAAQDGATARRITWDDLAPLHAKLEAQGMTAAAFPAYVDRVHAANDDRVRQGDLDHLVFYWLQSTHFTAKGPIEPALSAKALVDSLDERERDRFLKTGEADPARIPAPVKSRLVDLLRALRTPSRDRRQLYFSTLVAMTFREPDRQEAQLLAEYLRVMRFLYEKEFVAQRSARPAEAVAELYRSRGLSTDTAVEAGYLVYLGLGIVRSLDPDFRIRRVLIVGPGLDLAPRTSLKEVGPPESYQPWAVIDALLALGLSRPGELDVVAADINPRVVDHIRRSSSEPPTLTLVSEIRENDTVTFSEEFRDYFARFGARLGTTEAGVARAAGMQGHLAKTVAVDPMVARVLRAQTLDIVTDRLDGQPFDLVIATNVLPYFDDVQLMLAMDNIAGMLAPRGVFLHNEGRPLLHELTTTLGLPIEQSRHAVIASVRGAQAPLFDSVWLHRKTMRP